MKPMQTSDSLRAVIYDGDVINEMLPKWFDPAAHRHDGTSIGEALGRGASYIVKIEKMRCVLRHYRRGGAVASVLGDRYFWRSLEQTRAWQEWNLLVKMRELSLPVPHPVAAQVKRQGWFYRADLITEQIANSKTIAEILRKQSLPRSIWQEIGKTICRFHDSGIYHADLNAHNIMLADEKDIYLIDFDKCEQREQVAAWRQENMSRLKRSFLKLKSMHQEFFFGEDDWALLLSAYESASK
jgi:3-deoxy-D-manno-octulosonic acid kinase